MGGLEGLGRRVQALNPKLVQSEDSEDEVSISAAEPLAEARGLRIKSVRLRRL